MNLKGIEKQGQPDHKFQYMGVEKEETFDLNWSMMEFRPYDAQLGRLWGIDQLADLMPSISPLAYRYNNPLIFNDRTGLMAQSDSLPDRQLPEVTVYANVPPPSASSGSGVNSALWQKILGMSRSSNPIYRSIGLAAERGDTQQLKRFFTGNVSQAEGLGYTTEFMQGINRIADVMAKGAIGTAIVMYGTPILLESGSYFFIDKGVTQFFFGNTFFSKGYGWSKFGKNVFIDGFNQLATKGWDPSQLDYADMAAQGLLGLNSFGSAFIAGGIDFTPFNRESRFKMPYDIKDHKYWAIDTITGGSFGTFNGYIERRIGKAAGSPLLGALQMSTDLVSKVLSNGFKKAE